MPEEIQFREKRLVGRDLLTPIDVFRGADFSAGVLISGAVQSGVGVLSGGGIIYQVSSPVNVRVLNLEMANQEPGWLEVEFRDGHFGGGRVLGPYRLNPLSRVSIPYEQ